ncbi:hypothetical protein CRUP_021551 [Coryphaenoides rupestris]|nr:hypothetical protein CRUP_021551 [Coryphaenoides rupestris]
MGDHIEIQITPQTPGKPLIRNPFESPNDYHHLHEALVPSPSFFKHCKATTPVFNWAIEDIARLRPVDINPEDIQRQSTYLSQIRIDTDIEEKRQHAIEQTTLSLPVALDLEKILGEYYRSQDASEAVQECLSSSSLRRKLFLDGHGNGGSDDSAPPSPERGHADGGPRPAGLRRNSSRSGAAAEALGEPLACDAMATTPSNHGRFRDHSLGSMTSPMFPDGSSPAGFKSPSVSPIGPNVGCTPTGSGERKQLSFLTPDGAATTALPVYVEGCSPIRNGSPTHQLLPFHNQSRHPSGRARSRAARRWASPPLPLISPILNRDRDDQMASPPLASMEFDSPSSPSAAPARNDHLCNTQSLRGAEEEEEEEVAEEGGAVVGMETLTGGRLEDIERGEEAGEPSVQLTSSRMGNVSTAESSQMFVSLLAEGAAYATTPACSLDGLGSLCNGTANINSSNLQDEPFPFPRQAKVKAFNPHH